MKRFRGYCYQVMLVAMLLAVSTGAALAELTIQDAQPTDVTPSGFSVLFQASESATPLIAIYSDAEGLSEITSQMEITPYPLWGGDPTITGEYYSEEDMDLLRETSKSLGIIKIGVHGCHPNTVYYLRVGVDNGTEEVWWPETGTAQVTTASMNSFVIDSKQILITLVNNAGDLEADGRAVVISTSETLYPVSAIVGDGTDENQAHVNLARLFGTDGLNWTPVGSREVNIKILGGVTNPEMQTFSFDFSNDFHVAEVHALEVNVDGPQDQDGDGLADIIETRAESCTDDMDADSDDDGLADGTEDKNRNGVVDPGETDPCNADTDGDGIQDGTELGVAEPVADPDGEGPLLGTDTGLFVPDADPETTTDPLHADSDGDNVDDGVEDGNHDGAMDTWETDPNNDQSIPEAVVQLKKGFNIVALHAGGDLRDWLPVLGDDFEIEKVMVFDTTQGNFVTLTPGGSTGFILTGGEGLLVYAREQRLIGFASSLCMSPDLETGFNLVGFGCPGEGYSAFQLLNDLGSANISSIQRYDTEKGAFETAGFNPDGQAVGVDFPIVTGEGYFVFKR